MKKTLIKISAWALTLCSALSLFSCTLGSDETLAQMQNQIDTLNQNISSLQTTISKQEEAISSMSDEMDSMQTTIDSQGQYITDMTKDSYAYESYNYMKYIDENLHDRDCFSGSEFKATQEWIKTNALSAGYQESDIVFQDVEQTSYVKKTDNANEEFSSVENLSLDTSKTYKKAGWKFVEDATGEYYQVSCTTPNIIVTKTGKSQKQIIIGMHYDGDGTGDNGSGIALGLATLKNFAKIETPYTLKFIFFTAEEVGMVGSSYYANHMSQEEIDNTLYMINIDSIVCGDYCYLYGGVQDNDTQTVNQTEAYDNAVAIAKSLGLSFASNPWTWDNIAPENWDETYPDYASPSTGDWSDHSPFASQGITYLYFEATNWEIPDYTGYGETYLIGMLMNTPNDYLDYIETYFPGRILDHLNKFSKLLNALLLQPNYEVND